MWRDWVARLRHPDHGQPTGDAPPQIYLKERVLRAEELATRLIAVLDQLEQQTSPPAMGGAPWRGFMTLKAITDTGGNVTVEATFLDAQGNPITGATVTISGSGAGTVTDNGNGTANVTPSSTGTIDLSATGTNSAGTLTITDTLTVNSGAPVSGSFSEVSPAPPAPAAPSEPAAPAPSA